MLDKSCCGNAQGISIREIIYSGVYMTAICYNGQADVAGELSKWSTNAVNLGAKTNSNIDEVLAELLFFHEIFL